MDFLAIPVDALESSAGVALGDTAPSRVGFYYPHLAPRVYKTLESTLDDPSCLIELPILVCGWCLLLGQRPAFVEAILVDSQNT